MRHRSAVAVVNGLLFLAACATMTPEARLRDEIFSVDQALTNVVTQLDQGADPNALAPRVIPFLEQVANPDSTINRDYLGAVVDHQLNDPAFQARDKGIQVMTNLRQLYDTYSSQMDPVSAASAAMAINARGVGDPIPLPKLTPDQIGQLNWQYQVTYKNSTDPGWQDQIPTQYQQGSDVTTLGGAP